MLLSFDVFSTRCGAKEESRGCATSPSTHMCTHAHARKPTSCDPLRTAPLWHRVECHHPFFILLTFEDSGQWDRLVCSDTAMHLTLISVPREEGQQGIPALLMVTVTTEISSPPRCACPLEQARAKAVSEDNPTKMASEGPGRGAVYYPWPFWTGCWLPYTLPPFHRHPLSTCYLWQCAKEKANTCVGTWERHSHASWRDQHVKICPEKCESGMLSSYIVNACLLSSWYVPGSR